MAVEGKITNLSTSLVAQLQPGGTSKTSLSSVNGNPASSYFGPMQPLQPQAPKGVGGRRWDYPVGFNLQYIPRGTEAVGFADLRALADNLPILRAVIETRKDQVAGLDWIVRPLPDDDVPKRQQKVTGAQRSTILDLRAMLRKPDRVLPFDTWLRALLEEMLVIDAAVIYPRPTLDGSLYSLDLVDGSTIKPLIDDTGRRPEAPDPAYQQVLKGNVAANFTADELLYLPRNVRTSRTYGFSPVEQILLTVNIALRRDVSTLEYYRSGTVPDSFGTLPKEWTHENIKQFQDYFDSLMQGNTQARRGMRFMPEGFNYTEARQPPLKDLYDEWLARLICYVFSVPPTPFIAQVNRATAQTARLQAAQEGILPLQKWVKHFMDHIIQDLIGGREYEFAWTDGDQVDPVQQMTVLTGYVAAGVKSRDEVRDEIGEGPLADGTGDQYTISGPPLNPARLPSPEEQQAQHQQQMDLLAAKKPAPGEGQNDGQNDGQKTDAGKDEKPSVAKVLDRSGALRKEEVFEEAKHPRDGHGRFTSSGSTPSSRAEPDRRPRDENGRFIYSGGHSRGPNTAAARRKRLLQGLQSSAERAVLGGVLLGGAALATAVFAPAVGTAAALTIAITSSVGTAAIGEAAISAVGSTLEFMNVPASMRDTVQSGVTLALGVYSVADAKSNLDAYMAANHPGATAPAGTGVATKLLKADDAPTQDEVFDIVRAMLYEVGQDVVEGLKAKAAKAAKKGDDQKLASVNDTLEEVLEDFLDHVDKIGSPAPDHPDGGDRDSAKEHPVDDVSGHPLAAQKMAKGDTNAFDEVAFLHWVAHHFLETLDHTRPDMSPEMRAQVEEILNAEIASALTKSLFDPSLHPRGTGGKFAVGAALLAGVRSAVSAKDLHGLSNVISKAMVAVGPVLTRTGHQLSPQEEDAIKLAVHTVIQHAVNIALKFRKMEKADPWRFTEGDAPENRLEKAVSWKVLEPMWQRPAAEKESVSAFRAVLNKAFSSAASAVAKYVRAELSVEKMAKAKKPSAQEIADSAPLDDMSDAAGDLVEVSGDAAKDVAFGALARIGVGDDEGMVNRVSTRAVAQARDRAAELVGMKWDEGSQSYVENPNPKYAITDSTRDAIREIIATGLEENLSADDIADRIESSVAFSPERADLVAMTEIARVNSEAAVTAYADAAASGVRVKKKWIVAARDVCDDCTKNAQQEPLELDEEFQSGDISPPQHPNCRCAIAPVVDADTEDETDEEN